MNFTHLVLASLVVLAVPSLACAALLDWNRSPEADVHHYNLYYCPTTNCVVQKTAAMKQAGTVPQTLAGVKPSVTFTMGTGQAAVTAVDATGNESGLSNQAGLPVTDGTAPAAPTGFVAH
jgi:hypothetical protein